MKITIVQGAFLPIPAIMGGAVEKVWDALGKEFAKSGHEITHISRQHQDLVVSETLEGVRHIRVRGFDTPSSLLRLKVLDLIFSLRVLQQIPKGDILVTNTFWLPIVSWDLRRGLIYVHVARYPKGQMRFYRRAARLQTVTRVVADAIEREVPYMRSRVCVIPYPVNGDGICKVEGRKQIRRREILFVGRVHPEKGLDLLLRSLMMIPRECLEAWRVIIVGPSETRHGGGGASYLKQMKMLARPIAESINWVGPVFEPAELAEYYRRASFFVYPSLAEFGETFGLAPLEAMSHGCPPLVSALQCFSEYLKGGVNGFIFDHRADNPESRLADCIKKCIDQPDKLDKIGAQAMLTAQKYSVPCIARAFMRDFSLLMVKPKIYV